MNAKCKECNHLIFSGEDHQCPTPEYIEQRNSLIKDALDAEDMYDIDELEAYADSRRED